MDKNDPGKITDESDEEKQGQKDEKFMAKHP